MLIYSNHIGMPYNLNIYFHKGERYPWRLETILLYKGYDTVEHLFDDLKREGLMSNSIYRAIVHKALSRKTVKSIAK